MKAFYERYKNNPWGNQCSLDSLHRILERKTGIFLHCPFSPPFPLPLIAIPLCQTGRQLPLDCIGLSVVLFGIQSVLKIIKFHMQPRVLAPSENLSLSCHWALLYLNSVTEQEKMAREAVLGKSHVIYTLSTERNSNSIDHKLGFIWPLLAESHFLASRKAFLSLESET